jgi:hypothetical protein
MRLPGVTSVLCLTVAALSSASLAQMSPAEAMEKLRAYEAAEADPEPGVERETIDFENAPFNYEALPRVAQLAFERETINHVAINDEIWSIELLLRYDRLPVTSPVREAFTARDAPLFYNPVTDKRATSVKQIASQVDSLAIIVGAVAQRRDDTAAINTPEGIRIVRDLPEGLADRPSTRVVLLCRKTDDVVEITFDIQRSDGVVVGQKKDKAPVYRYLSDGAVRQVGPAELAEYFARHRIERFDRWQSKKVWDEQPVARKDYVPAGGPMSGGATRTPDGGGAAVGSYNPREVIVNPGKYHWQWLRGGKPVPSLRRGFTQAVSDKAAGN